MFVLCAIYSVSVFYFTIKIFLNPKKKLRKLWLERKRHIKYDSTYDRHISNFYSQDYTILRKRKLK